MGQWSFIEIGRTEGARTTRQFRGIFNTHHRGGGIQMSSVVIRNDDRVCRDTRSRDTAS